MSNSDIKFIKEVDELEAAFFDLAFLETEYAKKLRRAYDKTNQTCFYNPFRSYTRLLLFLSAIHEYRETHARSFMKRLRTQHLDFDNCEAIFAEVIVYAYYLPLIAEGIVRAIEIRHDSYDLRIDRSDGSSYFLEIFSVKPDKTPGPSGVVSIKTHLQEEFSSIRQKLLSKVNDQNQMSAERENWAVIELNDFSIAGDFSILSSLSDGYKVNIDSRTREVQNEGYDWRKSVFDDEATKHIRGIIWFDLGRYEDRRILLNPHYRRKTQKNAGM